MEKRVKEQLKDRARYSGVPEHTIDGLVDYIVDGIPPGRFLTAVLENNLMEAFGRADSMNTAALAQIAGFLYNFAPSGCHGSPANVRAWIKARLNAAAAKEK